MLAWFRKTGNTLWLYRLGELPSRAVMNIWHGKEVVGMNAYRAPMLREYGTLAELTLGCDNGNSDFGKGKVISSDPPPGNPNNGNEGKGASSCFVLS